MNKNSVTSMFALLMSMLLLLSCSKGGEETPAAQLNGEITEDKTAPTANISSSNVELLTVNLISDMGLMSLESLSFLDTFAALNISLLKQRKVTPVDRVYNFSGKCAVSGTYAFVWEDKDGNASWSVGDKTSYLHTNCVDTVAEKPVNSSIAVAYTAENKRELVMESPKHKRTLSVTNEGAKRLYTLSTSGEKTTTIADKTKIIYSVEETATLDISDNTLVVEGTYETDVYGRVRVKVPPESKLILSNPTSLSGKFGGGKILIEGAKGSSLTVTVYPTSLLLSVDSDGDKKEDYSKSIDWNK